MALLRRFISPSGRLIWPALFLFFFIVSTETVRAQCPTIDNIAWGQGAVVRFFLDPNLSAEQQRQIRLGIAEWNRANSLNNSRVRFEEDTTGQSFQFRFLNGSLGGNTAAFANKQFSTDGTVQSASLTYDPNATFPGSSQLIADPNQPGYSTIFIKLTLHEMGHTMGLDHPAVPNGDICAQPDGASVMNYLCNINDRSNNVPTSVAACDQQSINSESRYPPPANTTNPIDEAQFFVSQHYRDFLNREPDPSGFSFWVSQITDCGSDSACRELRRINVSAAFFLSGEFQQTGFFVYQMYQASFGRRVSGEAPVRFDEFLSDQQRVGQSVVVGVGEWQEQLEQNKQALALEFVQRGEFTSRYPAGVTPAQFVDALNQNTGGSLTQAQRDALVNQLSANQGAAGRAAVLRAVAENAQFAQRERSRAFVLMQYFGYLRRNPSDAPEATLDFAGFNFWLAKLNSFNGDFIRAEMVKAFITSTEYRERFGPS